MLKFLVLGGALALGACNRNVPETGQYKETQPSGVETTVVEEDLPGYIEIITDKETGCQYLTRAAGGITKREGSACPTTGPMAVTAELGSEENPSDQ